MQRIIKGLLQNKLIPSLDDILVDYSYISDHEDVIVLVNGVGQYAFRELIKLADGNPDKNFSIRPTDTIIIGTSPVPGLEVMAANASDALFSSGAKVVTISKKTVCSMHAHSEDIKMLLNILKPKYFMPVKGEYKSLLANAMLAVDLNMGFDYSNVIVYDNGMVAKFNDGKKDNMYNEIIETGNVYVDGLGVGDVENHVIITRQKMADNGVVILGATVSKSQRKVIAGPDVQMRGFIFLKDADNLVKDISTTFIDTLNEYLNTELQDLEECKNRIKEKIIFKIKKSTGKDPLIIPAVIEL
jgi:ribonuclease J